MIDDRVAFTNLLQGYCKDFSLLMLRRDYYLRRHAVQVESNRNAKFSSGTMQLSPHKTLQCRSLGSYAK